jgi:BolA protein
VDPTLRARAIEDTLRDRLNASHVEVSDQSARHASHAEARDGGGHFSVLVVAERFAGLDRIGAQRMVYQALEELIGEDIHAITMRTLTPEQWREQNR